MPESVDWINVLLAQVITKYRNDSVFNNRAVRVLYDVINQGKPDFFSPISITDFSLGDQFPKLKQSVIRYIDDQQNIRAEIAFDFNDQLLKIGIETHLVINFPKPNSASLPISLTLTLVRFSGTLAIEFISDTKDSPAYINISFLEDLELDFQVESLLGHRSKVKDLPKLTQIIVSRLKKTFADYFVHPNSRKIYLPSIWSDFDDFDDFEN